MCSLRLQPLARPLKKVLPVFLYSVAQTPDSLSSLPSLASCVLCANLSMLFYINLNSRRTWNYQSLFGHDTDAIIHVSLLRDGHHWTRTGLAWKEGTESWNGRLCRSHSTPWVEKRARTGLKTFFYSSPPLKSLYLNYDSPSRCTTKAHAFRIQACWRLSNLAVFPNFNLAANLISCSCCHASLWKGVLNSTEKCHSSRHGLFIFISQLNFLSLLYYPSIMSIVLLLPVDCWACALLQSEF